MASDKTLIILDTNFLKEGDKNKLFYPDISSRTDYKDFLEFLEKEKIKDKVIFGIPEVVFEEHFFHRNKSFLEDLQYLKEKVNQFNQMKILEEGKLDLKFKEAFDYRTFLIEFVEKNDSFVLLPIHTEKKKEIFEKVLKKSINHEKPFHKKSDRNFKDAVIWECLCCQDFRDYAAVIFLNQNEDDFPKNEDTKEINFASEKTGKIIRILYKYDDLEKELEKIYMFKERNLRNYILHNVDEFEQKIGTWIAEEEGIPFDSFKLVKPCEKIDHCTIKNLLDIGLVAEPIEEKDLANIEGLRFILVEFEMELDKKENYLGEVLYDLDAREVLHVRWDSK